MNKDTILVACPVNIVKDYSISEYISAYRSQTHKEKKLLFADNSLNDWYFRYLKWKYPEIDAIIRTPMESDLTGTIDRAWEKIITFAYMRGIETIVSIEADIIVPPTMLERMYKDILDGANVVCHYVPERGGRSHMTSLGCVMFRRENFPRGFSLKQSTYNFESIMYVGTDKEYRLIDDLYDGIVHLDYPDGGEELRRVWGDGYR